ncbi:hypothetical protein VOLCADRAFT_107900 [Volvox carteri f. nagariensis]|uniref:Uncharacterized protein n=1 Tax=Volvox carteri f. nagariensis TaxID=3068 RepID=D8UH32_VOLCA|nr:uncharacterized protein VOLCADRAFT_107900 [Volvox carteri f. nagariensis]EFJ40973.1 hypothetical protein VOLCADRAFT_107900 [Volvox carteri f. nagariensis]|eukprot:XP_002957947.1 hypothetical protein VOLCADRAFT_107900 [Volvox carteri f. nagariensis]
MPLHFPLQPGHILFLANVLGHLTIQHHTGFGNAGSCFTRTPLFKQPLRTNVSGRTVPNKRAGVASLRFSKCACTSVYKFCLRKRTRRFLFTRQFHDPSVASYDELTRGLPKGYRGLKSCMELRHNETMKTAIFGRGPSAKRPGWMRFASSPQAVLTIPPVQA